MCHRSHRTSPGPSGPWRARQEHCTGALPPSPLKTPPLTSEIQGPPAPPPPRKLPGPLLLAASALILHSLSIKTSKCQRTLNALTSVFSQTSPLHSEHLHPTWLQGALWSFTRAAGPDPNLTSTTGATHNLDHKQKPLVGREHPSPLSQPRSICQQILAALLSTGIQHPHPLPAPPAPLQSKLPSLFWGVLGTRGTTILNTVSGDHLKTYQISCHTTTQNTSMTSHLIHRKRQNPNPGLHEWLPPRPL